MDKDRLRPVIVTDVDGTKVRGNGFPQRGAEVDLRAVLENRTLLQRLGQLHGVQVSIITNKPAAQISQVAHLLLPYATAGLTHYGESGAVEIRPGAYAACVNESFAFRHRHWLEHDRPVLVEALRANRLNTFEPGKAEGATITVVNEGHDCDGEPFYRRVCSVLPSRNGSELHYETCLGGGGRMVDIVPRGHDKSHGAHEFLARHGSQVDASRSIWVGDTASDIPAARVFADAGFTIVAVGNADDQYKQFVHGCTRHYVADACRAAEHSFTDVLIWYANMVCSNRTSYTGRDPLEIRR